MPCAYVSPELFLEHNGVEVYHIYEDGGIGAESEYWFTLDPQNADEFHGHRRNGQFDVRRLEPRWDGTPTVAQWEEFWTARFETEQDAIEALIITAIDEGRLVEHEMVSAAE